MDSCFVIQPFDKDKFDLRYNDTFAPAIRAGGLEPYRVDRDPSVRIPIEQIETEIIKSKLCFAELTNNNPNVWYELGFAFAKGKDVVMVTEERPNFPFDIQHRQIIVYNTKSKSDFELLESQITEKIKALLSKSTTIEQLVSSPVKDSEGLLAHEITLMFILIQNQITNATGVSAYTLHHDMEKAGFNAAASNVTFRTLEKKGYIEGETYQDEGGYNYPAFKLTPKGEAWILSNQDKLEFKINPKENTSTTLEDLPF